MNEAELKNHRQHITEIDQNLTSVAGKAVLEIDAAFQMAFKASDRGDLQTFRRTLDDVLDNYPPPPKSVKSRPKLTGIRIKAEPRDEIDWDRFAYALLEYCRSTIEKTS